MSNYSIFRTGWEINADVARADALSSVKTDKTNFDDVVPVEYNPQVIRMRQHQRMYEKMYGVKQESVEIPEEEKKCTCPEDLIKNDEVVSDVEQEMIAALTDSIDEMTDVVDVVEPVYEAPEVNIEEKEVENDEILGEDSEMNNDENENIGSEEEILGMSEEMLMDEGEMFREKIKEVVENAVSDVIEKKKAERAEKRKTDAAKKKTPAKKAAAKKTTKK